MSWNCGNCMTPRACFLTSGCCAQEKDKSLLRQLAKGAIGKPPYQDWVGCASCTTPYSCGRVEKCAAGNTPINFVYTEPSGGYMQLIQQLNSVQVEGLQLDEAVFLLSIAGSVIATFRDTVDEVPQWLTDAQETLRKEVKSRAQDALERRLKELEQQEDRLKSAEEKRGDIKAEKARLLAKLRKPQAAPGS